MPPTIATGPARTEGPSLSPEHQKALAQVVDISSLPEITTRVVAVVENPKSTARDVHEIIRNDPALATKILKVVNSAFYGLPAQVASLDRAIVMLGLSAVKNIALAASLSRMFRPGAISTRFDARDLWIHCVSVGVCARLLAEQGQIAAEEIFVAGLVHDIGLLAEHQLFPEKLRETSERATTSAENFLEVERELIGADHQAFGAALASRWKFPFPLRNAIAYHHNPGLLQAELRRPVALLYVADTICCQNELGFWLTACNQQVSPEMLEMAGIEESRITRALELLPERIEEARKIFEEE
jgi:putative nucleotidyltransferase with HDIG domain